MLRPPVDGVLKGCELLSTGASKEYARDDVPSTEATVVKSGSPTENPLLAVHEMDVMAVHVSVVHDVEPIRVDGVASCNAKFRPVMVTGEFPVEAAFGLSNPVATGASNVRADILVATDVDTVSIK